ncbi:lysine N(6)-hydroxylase/L-ornithine N(5)-oxygenase family protein [Rhizobium sp. VS19-DR104.2]|uniref:lysine N(6)-hydroxylase/L-ornithine N(5)-oxygenase family protein n=1 Tax=unclassified Rhizobium TaxID=2613769 RepID=UPI001C5AED6C|nr:MULTISPECIES: SidA/IucD/PvdA family monooxygenase [unclassified Rhizobium]MBZ5763171.1 lysine N(6)-hydroxylase/L-ornithine N(5)-oxygenase family protein [Rhizobium sp. VS19-DR96]MBZ5769099.1 lysine N(6)-hydroxylase/L-ornithine N(5)-oxygenase family protein [Rhizobium sp. VS19-DR129.2]MBZ5776546.1 lysine N(6)-hydroxylase/L-ornithine N(5)-oxygenase family protein [Rhizobium sp. VS19-DRK62.2]MBZ5787790.1 lysine N(6)-hydroxylase/L-ornithine N(5)-oxygenase family protein [Rhizobium sp. VS19-DR121
MPRINQRIESDHSRGRASSEPVSDEVDILGIGFGPTNLGLAIAIEERSRDTDGEKALTSRFVEAKPEFGWHDGMLLPNVTMQISFLKDLVSLRTPTSPYTFVNYLHEKQRLSDFINLKTFFPSRKEFHDYLRWAADRISVPVSYGAVARGIEWRGGRFAVSVARSADIDVPIETIHARNIVVGMGYRPVLPEGIVPSLRIFHNCNLLPSLEKLPSRPNMRFLVVGAGQSAAEVVAYLHETRGDAEVHASLRRFGYSPSDDTPYVNRIFDPSSVDEFYTAPPELKKRLLAYHLPTNYSAVDANLISDLYRREYEETVAGFRRLNIHRTTDVEQVVENEDGVSAVIRDIGGRHRSQLKFDAIVFATGFQPFDLRDMLGSGIDADNAFDGPVPFVNRDYSLELPTIPGRIYLNGGVQHSHGLTSSLLSNVAMRSADILDAIAADARYEPCEQTIERKTLGAL